MGQPPVVQPAVQPAVQPQSAPQGGVQPPVGGPETEPGNFDDAKFREDHKQLYELQGILTDLKPLTQELKDSYIDKGGQNFLLREANEWVQESHNVVKQIAGLRGNSQELLD